MKPSWYVNLRITAGSSSSGNGAGHERADETSGPGGIANAVMAKLLHVVHGICAVKAIEFAAAFPLSRQGKAPHPGNLLRIFVGDRDEMDALLEEFEQHEFLAGYVRAERARPVPEGFGRSVCYRLYRISGARKSSEVFQAIRRRRLEDGNSLPYVRMICSGGQTFSIRFNAVYRDGAGSDECKPNGYGLSVKDREFYLPDLPVERAPWEVAGREARFPERDFA